MLQRANTSLNATLKSLGQGNKDAESCIQAAAEAKEQAEALRARLDKFEAVYGPDAVASSSVDLQQLNEQLQRKEDEIRKLRLELQASLEVRLLSYRLRPLTHVKGTNGAIHRDRAPFCAVGEPRQAAQEQDL